MLRRIDAWDGNIDRIVAVGAPLTLAIIAKAASLGFTKGGILIGVEIILVLAAITFEGVALRSAYRGKNAGRINLLDPNRLFSKWLDLSKREFQHWCVYYAGEDFRLNSTMINIKADRATECVQWLLISGILAAIAWVIAAVT